MKVVEIEPIEEHKVKSSAYIHYYFEITICVIDLEVMECVACELSGGTSDPGIKRFTAIAFKPMELIRSSIIQSL